MKSRFSWIGVAFLGLGLVAWHQGTPQANKPATARPAKAKTAPKAEKTVPAKPVVRKAAKKQEPSVVVPAGMKMAFQALPTNYASTSNPGTAAKINLGRMLYYEKRLSKNHDISCNSCHKLDKFGVDNEATSPGHKKKRGNRNSPTVYNAAGHIAQFWDGRSKDVEEQAKGPILNPVEMAMPNEAAVVKVLKSIPGYVVAFKKAFPKEKDPVTYNNLAKAIGAFERNLLTPGRWDKYLKGDKTALTNKEKKGLMAFVTTGCITCHTGPLLGGHMYQKLGLVKPWPGNKDMGRFEHTKKAYDKLMFKVPTLRNVEKTGPYLHDGSIKSLNKVVGMMAEYQLGRKLPPTQVQSIVAFLKALTGKVDVNYIKEPKLPANGPTTPKPNPN